MGIESNTKNIPEAILKLGDIRKNFLTEYDVVEHTEKYHRTVRAIWTLCSMFYQNNKNGISVTLQVPSERLLRLGLVSDEAGKAIISRKERKSGNGNLEHNVVTISKTEFGFRIVENYMNEEEFHNAHRIDSLVEETTELSQGENLSLRISIYGRAVSRHLHAYGGVWEEKPKTETDEKLAVTARRVNTTLALLAEGIYPNCIK
ncbi:MAG: hypothetical protein M1524_03080 [Patescibacteria group bacterium]|nr:hypothetical protein [Patescibacteria group bacterium]